MLSATFLVVALSVGATHAQGTARTDASTTAVGARPTAAEKRCMASRRRVERQNEAIVQADARAEKERTARLGCPTKRACENLDRALRASDARGHRLAKQLAQFQAEAAKACAPPPAPTSAYRSSTAAISKPTMTAPVSTK